MGKKLTTTEFVQRAYEVYGDKYDYSKVKYINNHTKVCIICPEHGEFWQIPKDHLRGFKCYKCGHDKIYNLCVKSINKFIEEANIIHYNKYDYSKFKYVNNKTKGIIICPIHGEFSMTPNNHISQKQGCPKCANEHRNDWNRKNTKQFIEEANTVHNNFYNYSKVNYINSKTLVTITCPVHGDFEQTPNDHLQNHGCPKCILKSQTKLYEKLKTSFPDKEILFEAGNSKVSWLGLQRFDIYFPKYNIAVEYNGIQHYIPVEHFGGKIAYEETIKLDELKHQKCKENNCVLFEVKYDYTKEDYQKLVENIQNIINNYDSSIEI